MRLFVAVDLDDSARRAAEETAEALRRAIGPALPARWIPARNMHLTVRFIGHVADDRAPAVLAALAPALPIAPFDIEFGGCGAFPPRGAPRVIWIGLAQGLPSLSAMHDELDRRLAPLGFSAEQRAFSAHLTLARVTSARGASSAIVRAAFRDAIVSPARWRVDRATIFQSHLSPRGPRYEAVGHVVL
jgi:2'-5' RNA ligase